MYVLKQKKADKEIDTDSDEEEQMIQVRKPNDSTSNCIVMYIDNNNI